MLTKEQALTVLKEEKEYEEKMFRGLVEVSVKEIKESDLTEKEQNEILEMVKHMIEETTEHEKIVDYLIKYVEVSDKDGF